MFCQTTQYANERVLLRLKFYTIYSSFYQKKIHNMYAFFVYVLLNFVKYLTLKTIWISWLIRVLNVLLEISLKRTIRFSVKAKKLLKISHLVLTFTQYLTSKPSGRFFLNCVVFSEYFNFINITYSISCKEARQCSIWQTLDFTVKLDIR